MSKLNTSIGQTTSSKFWNSCQNSLLPILISMSLSTFPIMGMVTRVPAIRMTKPAMARSFGVISAVKKFAVRQTRKSAFQLAAFPVNGGEPPAVTVVTWNVNSINARLPVLVEYLQRRQPDVLALQETKCVDEEFPRSEIEAQGYHVAFVGQKKNNGVAILSKTPLSDIMFKLPGDENDPLEPQARYLEATTCGGLRICNLYLPLGDPVGSDKFDYRLRWTSRLSRRADELFASEGPVVLLGDYNVCPTDADCFDAQGLAHITALHPACRAAYRELRNMGFIDAIKAVAGPPLPGGGIPPALAGSVALVRKDKVSGGVYSYWDYQGGSWERGEGLLIDHILMSPVAADRLLMAGIDWQLRAGERPSDHVPVWARLMM